MFRRRIARSSFNKMISCIPRGCIAGTGAYGYNWHVPHSCPTLKVYHSTVGHPWPSIQMRRTWNLFYQHNNLHLASLITTLSLGEISALCKSRNLCPWKTKRASHRVFIRPDAPYRYPLTIYRDDHISSNSIEYIVMQISLAISIAILDIIITT